MQAGQRTEQARADELRGTAKDIKDRYEDYLCSEVSVTA